jgi:hypothetical protein
VRPPHGGASCCDSVVGDLHWYPGVSLSPVTFCCVLSVQQIEAKGSSTRCTHQVLRRTSSFFAKFSWDGEKDVAVILEDFLRFSLAGLDKVVGAAFALEDQACELFGASSIRPRWRFALAEKPFVNSTGDDSIVRLKAYVNGSAQIWLRCECHPAITIVARRALSLIARSMRVELLARDRCRYAHSADSQINAISSTAKDLDGIGDGTGK